MTQKKTKRPVKHRPDTFPDDAHDLMVNKARFESKITKDPVSGCWIYNGPKHKQGYSFTNALRKSDDQVIMATAHRVAYRLYCGPLTKPNINHKCHNVACVNPAHLYNGTQKENIQDMITAGRNSTGPRGPYKPRDNKRSKPERLKRLEDIMSRPIEGAKQKRKYKYTEEEIQFARTASLDEIQARWGFTRARAVGFRCDAIRLYKWLPFPKD